VDAQIHENIVSRSVLAVWCINCCKSVGLKSKLDFKEVKSILNYFKLRRQSNLPDPRGSLSASLSPGAIASANKELEALLKTDSNSSSSCVAVWHY